MFIADEAEVMGADDYIPPQERRPGSQKSNNRALHTGYRDPRPGWSLALTRIWLEKGTGSRMQDLRAVAVVAIAECQSGIRGRRAGSESGKRRRPRVAISPEVLRY